MGSQYYPKYTRDQMIELADEGELTLPLHIVQELTKHILILKGEALENNEDINKSEYVSKYMKHSYGAHRKHFDKLWEELVINN